jgi:hypothetical protein
MLSQMVAMLILSSSAQGRGDQRLDLRRPPAPARNVTTVHIRAWEKTRELTLEMPAQDAPDGEADDQPAAMPVMRFDFRLAVLQADNFDRWLFDNELSEQARQEYLKAILDSRISAAARAHKLTDPQRAKLRLAGRGDIKRFFDDVQKRRDAFEIDRRSFIPALRRCVTSRRSPQVTGKVPSALARCSPRR